MYIDQTRMSTKVKNTQKSISERLRGKTGRLRGMFVMKALYNKKTNLIELKTCYRNLNIIYAYTVESGIFS